jgi:sugar phosphate isomerase/epimerase
VFLNRRELLGTLTAAVPVLHALAAEEGTGGQKRLGVVIHSYMIRSAADRGRGDRPPFSDPINFLEYCGKLGAGGVQVSIGVRDKDYIARLRSRMESSGMFLEGSVRLPQNPGDVDRFASEVKTARAAGVTVLRSAILSGRRYETFNTAAEFQRFSDQAYKSLGLAEPVVARQEMRLAVENHKDWRADELIDLLKRLSSQYVGVCIDTGNSIALLEEPMAVVEAYAPWAFSTHLKDMGVAEYEDGFLLSEVPFGAGFLDMKRIIEVLRRARPEVRFNVEMITRDPLKVPCLTRKYWATFEMLPGRHLADTLAMVRRHASKQPLPRISHLPQEKRLDVEDQNVRACLAYAWEHLGL